MIGIARVNSQKFVKFDSKLGNCSEFNVKRDARRGELFIFIYTYM